MEIATLVKRDNVTKVFVMIVFFYSILQLISPSYNNSKNSNLFSCVKSNSKD
jgi:hypothetical protein